jgi:hypothetical protein
MRLTSGRPSPLAIGRSRRASRARTTSRSTMVATSLATQALPLGTTGRHWMKQVPHLSSDDGPYWDQLKGFGPTRKRWQPEHLNSGR